MSIQNVSTSGLSSYPAGALSPTCPINGLFLRDNPVSRCQKGETIPIPLETSGGVLSAVDMVVQLCDSPRQIGDYDDDHYNEPTGVK